MKFTQNPPLHTSAPLEITFKQQIPAVNLLKNNVSYTVILKFWLSLLTIVHVPHTYRTTITCSLEKLEGKDLNSSY